MFDPQQNPCQPPHRVYVRLVCPPLSLANGLFWSYCRNAYFEQLRGMFPVYVSTSICSVIVGEIITILENDTGSRETIHRLETELEVYKRAYADLGEERKRFEKLNRDAEKHAEELKNQLKVASNSIRSSQCLAADHYIT
jgi:hypothetical protein